MQAELQLKMYRDMLRIRIFEEIVRDRFADSTISGSVHLYIGEEAIAVGACSAIHTADYITSSHRGHGHILAKGGDVRRMMAELFAKKTGYNKAKGGSMHLAAPDIGMLGANGIVGGGIPIATGVAMAAKKLKNNRGCLCFFGDGAANQGTFHEGINIAASYNLPCIYICENNMYAGGVKQYYDGVYRNEGMDYPRKIKDIADRARAYDIPGYVVDGNDVEAVYNTVFNAVKAARDGAGPSLIECKTYRWRTHFEIEPDTYRDQKEVETWKDRCPIKNYGAKLLKEGIIKQSDLDLLASEVNKEMEDAVQFSLASPEPDDEESIRDVYAD